MVRGVRSYVQISYQRDVLPFFNELCEENYVKYETEKETGPAEIMHSALEDGNLHI